MCMLQCAYVMEGHLFDAIGKNLSFSYEAYPESKDTKVWNMYNIFNLQKRHPE